MSSSACRKMAEKIPSVSCVNPPRSDGRDDHGRVLEAVVVVDRAADVEDRRGVHQHLADTVPRLGVERLVEPVARSTRRSAPFASHVANRAESVATEIVRTQRGEEPPPRLSAQGQAFAHPAARNDDTVGAELPHHLEQHEGTSEYRVGPVGVQRRHLGATLHRARRQLVGELAQAVDRQRVPVQQPKRMFRAAHVDLRQVADRAADPDQVVAAIEASDPAASSSSETARRSLRICGAVGGSSLEEPIAHAERPQVERPGRSKATVLESRHLDAATADVDRRSRRHGEVMDRARRTRAWPPCRRR